MKGGISSSMCLSLDWDALSGQQVSISHSDGALSVVDVRESDIEVLEQRENAHDFGAWCIEYDTWRPGILYSGGDDCHFCAWDIRQGLSQPIFREKRAHSMGVCSIQSNPLNEHLLVTGSYDEKLRLWDTRILKQPIMEKDLGLGGGVWKVKWNPFHKDLLLAACMHNGFMVVRVKDHEFCVVMEYKKHASLAYGVDWFKGLQEGTATESVHNNAMLMTEKSSCVEHHVSTLPLVASCSFYDRSLHIWNVDIHL
ncbi:hypothetical protein KP509_10G062800 [Ceratopteris richardii]|nr:hypothetical protein KP509_10G062800 [Ceratopteris richardii]